MISHYNGEKEYILKEEDMNEILEIVKNCNIPVVSNCYQLTSKELAKVKEYGTNVVKMMTTGIGTSVSTLNDKNEWVDITDYDSW